MDTDEVRAISATRSGAFMDRARRSLAGGDSSSMRVLPYQLPLVAARGSGSRIWDIDDNEYIDLNMAFGPLILGHRPPVVGRSVVDQILERGSQLGFPTEISVRVAEKIASLYPSIQLLRFANSGTEATTSAARLARTYTGRPKLVVFEGHYHGWSDTLFHNYHAELSDLPSRGYGWATPGTSGMGRSLDDVIVARWNDLEVIERIFEEHGSSIAAIMMEPVMANAGVIPPEPGFLSGVRELTRSRGTLLIFDEVITGMRVAAGGAQELYDVEADITVLSKAFGGGYPVAAFGASEEIMQPIVDGRLFHGGVYAGNATVMAAAEAVLDQILEYRASMYEELDRLANYLAGGIHEAMATFGIPHLMSNVGPMISLFITDGAVDRIAEYRDLRRHGDFARYIALQHAVQQIGVYFHPNMFEPMYLSTAHTAEDIDRAIEAFHIAGRSLAT